MTGRTTTFCGTIFVAIFTLSCVPNRTEENKETVLRMIEAVNARNFAVLDEVIATNVKRHSGATPGLTVENLEQFKEFLHRDLAAVPDAQQEVHFIFAEGDRVAVYVTYRGTQRGPMGPFPPSNRSLELPFIGILRLEDSKIVEMWVEWDNLNALTQLGHFPPATDASTTPDG